MEDFYNGTVIISYSGNKLEEDNDSLTRAARSLKASTNSTFSTPVGIVTRVFQIL